MWCIPSPLVARNLRNARIVPRRFQQLDLGAADLQEYAADALVFDDPVGGHRQPERVAIELHRLVRALHNNSDVVDLR